MQVTTSFTLAADVAPGRYVVGIATLAVVAGSAGALATLSTRRWRSTADGPTAALGLVVVAVAIVFAQIQVLGTTGRFDLLSLAVFSLVALAVAAVVARRRPSSSPSGPLSRRKEPGQAHLPALAGVAVALGVAGYTIARGVWHSASRGIEEYDSLWYHLPFAARFADTGWLTRLHYVGNLPDSYLPANAEVVHALGMVAVGDDSLSPIVNLAWLVLAVLSAWTIGDRFDAGWASAAAVVLVLVLPVVYTSQMGTAGTDVPALALVLAATALATHTQRSSGTLLIAGIAAGMAVATKLTVVIAVVGLTLVVPALALRGHRLSSLATWFAGLLPSGLFWYVRNLVHTGNPLPWFDVDLGPLALRGIRVETIDCGHRSVLEFLAGGDGSLSTLSTGLRWAFGPLWWLVLVLAVVAVSFGIVERGNRELRAIAAVAALALVGYTATPATAGGEHGSCFYYNTRFLTSGLSLSLVLLPGLPILRKVRLWLPLILAVFLATNLVVNNDLPARTSVLAVVIAIAFVFGLTLLPKKALPATALASVAAAVLVAFVGHQKRPTAGWADGRLPPDVAVIANWARTVDDATIAIAGFTAHYPAYGAAPGNTVTFLAAPSRHGAFDPVRDCDEWRRRLRQEHVDYVALADETGEREPREALWTRGDDAAIEILHMRTASVFRLREDAGPPERCS